MPSNTEFTGTSLEDILRQYYSNSLYTTFWRDTFANVNGFSFPNLAALSINEYTTSSHLYPFSHQPSRLTITTTNETDRMVNRLQILPPTGDSLGETSGRLLCQPDESSDSGIFQLEMGPVSNIDQCSIDSMEPMDASFPMPALEPSSPLPPTPHNSSDVSNHHHARLAERHLVPPVTVHDNNTTSTDSSNSNTPCSIPIRRPYSEESSVASSSLEHKRRRLALDGYDDNAMHVFLNPEANPSTRQYNQVQQKFITWCQLHQHDYQQPIPSQLINYLAHGIQSHKWQTSTCLSYKSALLDLYTPTDRQHITQDPYFEQFFRNLKATTVRSFHKPFFDLSQVLATLISWGSNNDMNSLRLTRKLCFLLAITGFLRPADIHRIDLASSSVSADISLPILTLVIDCPKEKRLGSPIIKQVQIQPHPDPLLCPVRAFVAYTTRVASQPCIGRHPTRPSRTLSFLIRSLQNVSTAVGPQTISRHINSIIDLIPRPSSTTSNRRPRARALGSTNAAISGANLQDILTHGSWASSSVYDNFYRLSRATATNFTTLSLFNNAISTGDSLQTQSESPTQDQ